MNRCGGRGLGLVVLMEIGGWGLVGVLVMVCVCVCRGGGDVLCVYIMIGVCGWMRIGGWGLGNVLNYWWMLVVTGSCGLV